MSAQWTERWDGLYMEAVASRLVRADISILRRTLVFLVLTSLALSAATFAKEAPTQINGAQTVALDEALALYAQGAVFIDVRQASAYHIGHIKGSVHLDFTEDEFILLYISGSLERDTPIVFYSESPLVNSGAMASYFAAAWGYENVYFFRDGFYAWLAADYPIAIGAQISVDSVDDENYLSADLKTDL